MQYALVITKGKSKELYKLYDNIEQAERKLKKTFIENGSIVKVPDVRAGYKFYKQGRYFMTVVNESKNIFFLNNPENPMFYDDCILKTNMNKYFYLGIFDGDKEEFDEEYANNIFIDEFAEDEVANDENETDEDIENELDNDDE